MNDKLINITKDLNSKYVTTTDLQFLLPTTNDARYGLVKRALKKGTLIKLRRGVYLFKDILHKQKPHPFEIAENLYWPSYISLESALSFHGLIPEAIYSTTCVTTQRSRKFQNEFGIFKFNSLPRKNFFLGVERVVQDNAIFLVASPWKAITDYVYCYKKKWTNIEPLIESLRLDIEEMPELEYEFINKLIVYYNNSSLTIFLQSLLEFQYERGNNPTTTSKLPMQNRT